MLSNEEILQISNLSQDALDNLFVYQCEIGRFEAVKYLLTSSDLKIHANINYEGDEPILVACQAGHLEIVKYLLTSPELTEHADIYTRYTSPLRWACMKGHHHIMEYLVLEYGIKENDILHIVRDNPELKKIYNRKENFEKLNENLFINNIEQKKIKL